MGALAAAAPGSLILGGLSSLAGAGSQLAAGQSQADQYNYQAAIAANNAALTRANVQAELASSNYDESISKLHTTQTVASQRAAQGANGIDLAIGSPGTTRESTQLIGDLDAAMIHFNASRAAFAGEASAANLDTQASVLRTSAANAKAAAKSKALNTILSGALSTAGKYASFKQSGAMS